MTDSGPINKNLLCYGDNLTFLEDRSLLPDACVDLIYLDPPFNSQQDYNVLFKETSGTPAAAQIKAFEDTWRWDMAANEALARLHQDEQVPAPLVELMKTFMNFLKPSPMMAYLVQMAVRLVHMHRVLKPTGSLYLHCDPTASHYLKLVLDAIFGAENFRNEIIWKRTSGHSDARRYGSVHDVIHFYVKNGNAVWNKPYQPYDPAYVEQYYRYRDPDGRMWMSDNLSAAGLSGGGYEYEWKGIKRIWRCPQERMAALDSQGKVFYTKNGIPRLKRYLDEAKGLPAQDVWGDLEALRSWHKEKLGYPTQKPIELLLRIVAASSNPGDVILDPFCGCGTTIDAVETLNREDPAAAPRTWIGIDITHLSINLIKHRLTRFVPLPDYQVIGEPASVSGAEALAQQDPYQFQFWALGLVGARPRGGAKKKGADQGIDGVRYFQDELKAGAMVTKTMLVQVKSGKVGAKDIRDFVGTLAREQAELGVFLTLQDSTAPMRTEAAAAGMYASPWNNENYPRVQILTIEELMKDPHLPNPAILQVPGGAAAQHTLQQPQQHKGRGAKQGGLFGGEAERGTREDISSLISDERTGHGSAG
ncbi:MAG: DNA methyltransferase [Planctomycetaceae bacterium]|nr:restriction endonuclease [Planctomycetaceae bacterium]